MMTDKIDGRRPGQRDDDMSTILEARGIGKSFGGVQALRGIDFTLRPQELRCLTGLTEPARALSLSFCQVR